MPKNTSPYPFLTALASYPGGKRKLLKSIFASLASVLPVAAWPRATFTDAFAGGGSVSLFAKAQGFGQLISNDWSERTGIIHRALISNRSTRLTKTDLLILSTPVESLQPGFIEREFGGDILGLRHAQALDRMHANLPKLHDPAKKAMSQLLIWKMLQQFVAFATTIGTSNRPFAELLDGKRNWWELNPKRLQDNSVRRLLEPVWEVAEKKRQQINQGVFSGAGQIQCHRKDAFQLVGSVTGDILYLDPPYPGTMGYEKENRVLDAMLLGHYPVSVSSTSPFTQGTEALSDLFAQSRHFPIWIISYGNKVTSLDGLKALVQKVDPNRTVTGWAKNYVHLSYAAKTSDNQELLVMAVDHAALQHRYNHQL